MFIRWVMINDLSLHKEQSHNDVKVKSWIDSDFAVFDLDIELTEWIHKDIDICVTSWHQTVCKSLLWKEQASLKRSLAVSRSKEDRNRWEWNLCDNDNFHRRTETTCSADWIEVVRDTYEVYHCQSKRCLKWNWQK